MWNKQLESAISRSVQMDCDYSHSKCMWLIARFKKPRRRRRRRRWKIETVHVWYCVAAVAVVIDVIIIATAATDAMHTTTFQNLFHTHMCTCVLLRCCCCCCCFNRIIFSFVVVLVCVGFHDARTFISLSFWFWLSLVWKLAYFLIRRKSNSTHYCAADTNETTIAHYIAVCNGVNTLDTSVISTS